MTNNSFAWDTATGYEERHERSGGAMNPQPFVHGTTYYHFAHPREEFAADFAAMRELGLNAVRVAEIWPGWDVLEPARGDFDFGDLDAFVQEASRAGLRVVMGVGINSPPDWVFNEIEDVRCVDASGALAGRRVQSANHDNPEYRAAMGAFIATLAARYAPNPAVMAWQMGNEVRYGVRHPDNPCTRARFREWLQARFGGDLDALNRAWATRYASWPCIYPYLSGAGAPTEGLTPLLLATKAFLRWSLEELVAWGTSIVREHSDKPVFHNNHGVSGEAYNHWRMAASGDWAVQDIYPTMGGNGREALTHALDLGTSVAAALAKPYVIGETGIAQYGTYRRNRPEPQWCECLVMEMLATGARGVLYFRHRAPKHEQPHKFTGSQAVFRRDGTPTAYARTIRRVTEFVGRHGARLRTARPVEPTVVAYYPEESLGLSGEAGFADVQHAAASGASALWNRAGVPLRLMDTERLLGAPLERYAVVYLPMCYLLPAEVGSRLAAYVKSGGTLIAECRPGYVDALGWVYADQPGAGLHEVFGAREDLFWETSEQDISIECDGWAIRAKFPSVAQNYRTDAGEAVARNERGEIVAVRNRYGRGTAWLFGFAPSLAFASGGGKYQEGVGRGAGAAQTSRAAVELVGRLARAAGVERPLAWSSADGELNVRYLREEDGRVIGFFANHGEETTVVLPPGATAFAVGTEDGMDDRPRRGEVRLPRHAWAFVEA
jgi:beta-galactosidase GanA